MTAMREDEGAVHDPYMEGQVAAAMGIGVELCPYPPESYDWQEWQKGHAAATWPAEGETENDDERL